MGKNCVFFAISYTKRKKVENAIRSYLESKGLEVITGRDVTSGGNLCDEIIKLIKECDFGVVVYNELRHNISYEWGLLDVMGKYVVVLKDENIHIDLDYELSDKKGTIFTPFYGEDSKEDIIKQLKENKGLERALEKNIEQRISNKDTPEAKKASELLVKSDLQLGEISKDIKELSNSEEILEALDEIKNLSAEGHFIKGNAFYSDKKFEEAIKEYSMAIELDFEFVGAYNNRGNAYDEFGKLEEALVDYNKAIEFDPEYANAYNNRGNVYFELKKFDDAINDYNKAIEHDPENPTAYHNRGNTYSKLKEFDDAINDYNKAIERDPDFAAFYNNRGNVYLELKKFDDAINDYNKAIELDPESIHTYQNLAEAYILNKKHKESFKIAQKSLNKSKSVEYIIVSKCLITISLILQGKGKKEEKELIEYINQNKGYDLLFEFDPLKKALKESKYSSRINKLIKLVEENAA